MGTGRVTALAIGRFVVATVESTLLSSGAVGAHVAARVVAAVLTATGTGAGCAGRGA